MINELKVNEIFLSIQGESKWTGFPTVFLRLTGCNLRCSYCDTKYAYEEGTLMTKEDIMNEICKYSINRVCITGGEPLLYELKELLNMMKDFYVTVETNGSVLIDKSIFSKKHSVVMDLKTPSSKCSDKNCYINLDFLDENDELKFVIEDFNDYKWAKDILMKYDIKALVTFSGVYNKLENKLLIEWILNDRLDVVSNTVT